MRYHPSTQRASTNSLRNKEKEAEVGGRRVLLIWESIRNCILMSGKDAAGETKMDYEHE